MRKWLMAIAAGGAMFLFSSAALADTSPIVWEPPDWDYVTTVNG